MNRLIIIGNGFDLAHGLETSYQHFMISIVSDAFNKANDLGAYKNEVFAVTRNRENSLKNGLTSLTDYCNFLEKRVDNGRTLNSFDWDINDELFTRVINNCKSGRWVDIEDDYYRMLVDIILGTTDRHERESKAVRLNNSMDLMKSKLRNYLKRLEPAQVIQAYNSLFYQDNIKDYCILDYNYTRTSSMYTVNGTSTVPVIHIHGEISKEENPLVFGFGDYQDKWYHELENANVNALLDNIKLIQYKETKNNYEHLISFINTEEKFEVLLFGHSCGLSDRSTLSEIFNHRNCFSIRIYHHENHEGKNNYKQLSQEIMRHLGSKQLYQDRLLPYDSQFYMPQHDS